MNHINVKKFGLASGLTGALLYLGCMFLMITVGHDGTVKFFNSLLHGLDVSSVVRMGVPLWEASIIFFVFISVFILNLSNLQGRCSTVLFNMRICLFI